jgi:hypothetical protein
MPRKQPVPAPDPQKVTPIAEGHLVLPVAGVRLLLEAYDFARGLQVDAWDFAVEARYLTATGLTCTHLRWLLHKGYALQGLEQAPVAGKPRRFGRVPGLYLSDRACFALTESGAAYANDHAGRNRKVPGAVRRGESWLARQPPAGQGNPSPRPGPGRGPALAPIYRELRGLRHNVLHGRGNAGEQAVPLSRLRALGADADCVLRMMYHDHVKHFSPLSVPHQGGPTLSATPSVRVTHHSCFALTEEGEVFAALLLDDPGMLAPETVSVRQPEAFFLGTIKPQFDRSTRALRWGLRTLKRFRQASDNQELILLAAEELNWPAWFDDPLPRRGRRNPKVLLHDTIKDLNRHQTPYLIHFKGDGTGTRIGWEYW